MDRDDKDLKKWKALETFSVFYLPEKTIQDLDKLLNPYSIKNWKRVAEELKCSNSEITYFESLRKEHGSSFRNMLEYFQNKEEKTIDEFVKALYSTGRRDVKDTIENAYEDIKRTCHHSQLPESAGMYQYSQYRTHIHAGCTDNYVQHSPGYRVLPQCVSPTHPQDVNPGITRLLPPVIRHTQPQPMDMESCPVDVAPVQMPAKPHQGIQEAMNLSTIHETKYEIPPQPLVHTIPTPVYRRNSCDEDVAMKSAYGLEHPPYTPVPNSARMVHITKQGNDDTEQLHHRNHIHSKGMHLGVNDGERPRKLSAEQVLKTDSFSEAHQKSVGSSTDSFDSGKSHTFPKYEKGDSTQGELCGRLRSSHSTHSRLESGPFCTVAVKEVFLTYADDQPNMKYIHQLLDNLQRNKFKTSADAKDKSEAMPEQIIRRFQRSDFVIVCISPKYKEQVSHSSPLKFINMGEKLHTAEIYQMMKVEVRTNSCNDRFIPVLLKDARTEDIPEWLGSICPPEIFYRWPAQYKSLLFHMLQPKKLVECYQRSMRDMSKRSLQSTDRKSQQHSKHPKYNSYGK